MRRCLESRGSRERSRSREPSYARETPPIPRGESSTVSDDESSITELHVLYASPLDPRFPQIDIQAELQLLQDALLQANSNISIHVGIATSKSVAKLLALARTGYRFFLHLSAHVVQGQPTDPPRLVLENDHGGAHILDHELLDELLGEKSLLGSSGSDQSTHNPPLIFINSCYSEPIANLLIESGCPVVLATRGDLPDKVARQFTHEFYFALGSKQTVLDSFNKARTGLRLHADPKFKEAEASFLLFGQHIAKHTSLSSTVSTPRSTVSAASRLAWERKRSSSGFPTVRLATSSDQLAEEQPGQLPPQHETTLPAKVEDFVGRTPDLLRILQALLGDSSSSSLRRRAIVVTGPEGIGKSAVAAELARFAAAPGRPFGSRVLHTHLKQRKGDGFLGRDGRPEQSGAGSPGNGRPTLGQRDSLRLIWESLARSLPDFASAPRDERREAQEKRVLRGFQQFDKSAKRTLVLVDDSVGIFQFAAVRQVLSDLLESTQSMSMVLFSREHIYESLGCHKCINMELKGLERRESAQLFLKRIHRPLQHKDFQRGHLDLLQQRVQQPQALEALSEHQLLEELQGNPKRLRSFSDKVTPELPSLLDLCRPPPAVSAPSFATGFPLLQPFSTLIIPGCQQQQQQQDGLSLQRHMSIDSEVGQEENNGLQREMSIDEQL